MKKLLSCMLAALVVACVCAFAGCSLKDAKEPHVLKESDKYIVITVAADQMTLTENTTLADYMASLKEDGELTYEIKDGMITSVNGIANAADYSSCWMLYTSDADNANEAWGTVDYKDNVYGSAMFGAETLKVKDGCLYIWLYQSFN